MKLRVIPTKVHGAIDYVTAPALVAAPDLLRLDRLAGSSLTPRVAGAFAAAYSALTDYELGVRRVLPMRAHLALDAASGAVVAAAPWLFGSARRGVRHWLPHALVGAGEVGLALTTETRPRRTGVRRLWDLYGGRSATVALPLAAVGVAAYAGRRYLLRGVALVADAVEEAADAVEDAADFVEDLAEDVADAARAKAGEGERAS